MLRQAAAASGGGEEETRVQELKDASAKDIRALEEKLETLEKKHSREMAGRDGLEEKKERIVEELVNEIVADLEESQRLVEVLRARISQHDTEVEEIHNDWLQDNQKLAREVQRLKLAAKRTGNVVVEQEEEISNDMDKTLVDGLLLLSSESKRKATEVEEENATGDSEAQDDESSSDMGSPTSTIAGDLESIHALEEPLWTARKLGSLSERGTSPKKSPLHHRPFNPPPVLRIHPQSPAALALNSGNVYTTSKRLLARCKRTRPSRIPIRFPSWSMRGGDEPRGVVERLAKRVKVD